MYFSRNGQLNTTLHMSVSPVTIDGNRYVTMNYNGSFPGPTLVFCPGDTVRVRLINALHEETNLHVHGLHVSPQANHDNVYLEIKPGRTFHYEYSIPDDQDPGTFWYHPHRHMLVEQQIFAGLSGGIIVQGRLDDELARIPQRIMVIQSTELCDQTGHSVPFGDSGSQKCSVPGRTVPVADSDEQYTPLLINGALNPIVHIRPGQIQRWRIINANDNRIVKLTLANQTVQVLAQDGNTLRWMRPEKETADRTGIPARDPGPRRPSRPLPDARAAVRPVPGRRRARVWRADPQPDRPNGPLQRAARQSPASARAAGLAARPATHACRSLSRDHLLRGVTAAPA